MTVMKNRIKSVMVSEGLEIAETKNKEFSVNSVVNFSEVRYE